METAIPGGWSVAGSGIGAIRFKQGIGRFQLGEAAACRALGGVGTHGVHPIIAPAIDFRGTARDASYGWGVRIGFHGVLQGLDSRVTVVSAPPRGLQHRFSTLFTCNAHAMGGWSIRRC